MAATFDASTLRRAVRLSLEAFQAHREEIDSLNVFPIADGDTGTNLVLTMEAVDAAVSRLSERASMSDVAQAISRASLMGARGNSGVILSQVLRGLCERLDADRTIGGEEIARALAHASDEGFRAVARPVDGTMLTVLRDAARSARQETMRTATPASVVAVALAAARESLARTTERLPELRAAGVVDAGAKGIVLLLDALHAALTGSPMSEPKGALGPVGRVSGGRPSPSLENEFEVQYLLQASDERIPELRADLAELGDSLVIVGGGELFNVHVHTDQPDRAIAAGHRIGRPLETSVTHLGEQVANCLSGQARAVRLAEQICAMVAVADGAGLAATFRSLGAVVVRGGRGSPTSADELIAAIESADAAAVVVLPNCGEVLPVAERAASQSAKEVHVVRAGTVPSGLAAAAAFNPFGSMEENAKAMEEAALACRSGELVKTEDEDRMRTANAGTYRWAGFAEGEAVAIGDDAATMAVEVVRRLTRPESELVTLVVGNDGEKDRPAVEDALRRAFGGLDLQVVEGGQPQPPFLIGVE